MYKKHIFFNGDLWLYDFFLHWYEYTGTVTPVFFLQHRTMIDIQRISSYDKTRLMRQNNKKNITLEKVPFITI